MLLFQHQRRRRRGAPGKLKFYQWKSLIFIAVLWSQCIIILLRYFRTGRTVSVSPKPNTRCVTDEDESTQERSGNQNVNLSVPPTPKKKRLGENVPKTTTTTLGDYLNNGVSVFLSK